MRKFIISAFLLLGLAACATPTPYQPAADGFGYSDQRIESNRYRIVFSGNSLTSRQAVDDYMLYRAAELTLEKGYDYFEVADRQTDKSTRYLATYTSPPFPYYGYYYRGRFYPDPFPPVIETGSYRPVESYTTSANIVLHRGRKPADKLDAYDAQDVISRLGPVIRYPAPKAG